MSDGIDVQPNPMLRNQKICVLRRNSQYWLGGMAFGDDIRFAKVFPEKQAVDKARIEIGLPCEVVYVCPMEIPGQTPAIVGDAAKSPKSVRRW